MLTVADALKLEQFADSVVVAGKNGLTNRVAWVHIASVPDAPHFLNGGELVLTTGHNIPEDPEQQRWYVQAMAEIGVAGLVLSVGRYIDHATAALIETAEKYQFPLIEIPYQARFV